MDQDSGEAVDLFGEPWRDPKDRRGRKPLGWQQQVAEKVAVLRAGGSTQEEIAARLGTNVKTLKRYYSRELKTGPTLARQLLNEKMWARAMDGNVAAARYCRDELTKGEAQQASEAIAARANTQQTPAPRGKKEERQHAAEQIGGRLAPPSAPKLALVKS